MATIKDKLASAAATGRERAVGAMQALRGAPVTTGAAPATAAPAATPATAAAAPVVSDTPAFQRPDVMERVAARRAQPSTPFRPAPFDPGAGRAGPRPVMDLATPEMKGLRTPAVSVGSRVAGAARAVGGMPGLVGGAALYGGMAAGGRIAEYVAGDVIDRAYGTTRNQVNQPLVDEIVAQNPNGKLATFLAGGNPNQATAAPAPAETGTMQNVFAPGDTAGFAEDAATSRRIFGPEAQRLAEGIRSGAVSIPTRPGTGAVVASDGSGGTVFGEGGGAGSGGGQGRQRISPREAALQTLQREATQDFGDPLVGRRGRREAANALLDYYNKDDANQATLTTAKATADKTAAELDDKRMKDFNEQFVNNQFFTSTIDKNGNMKDVPDVARNAAFLDFARQVDPRFATSEGILQLTKLPTQDRSKLVADLRKQFLQREIANKEGNDRFFDSSKRGMSNGRVQLGREVMRGGQVVGYDENNAVEENTLGTALDNVGRGNLGLRPLYNWLPGADSRIVYVDGVPTNAVDFIGDAESEGSGDRRALVDDLTKRRGLR